MGRFARAAHCSQSEGMALPVGDPPSFSQVPGATPFHTDPADNAIAVDYAAARYGDDGTTRTAIQDAPVRIGQSAQLDAVAVSAWFGSHKVLERVSLSMPPGVVTALIGPSGCGKSTFLRILNRMHETAKGAQLAGEVRLNGQDIYAPGVRVTETRNRIGMVFQKPNPFPAMSIAENVVAGLQLTGVRVSRAERAATIESCLSRAGLWNEVKDRLAQPGGALSGGQQQRLCIARSLAVKPDILLMDEPCSALDPGSTARIEQTITDLMYEVTIVIVTHNMQQAARVSQQCAFFLAEQGAPGGIVEAGATEQMFRDPQDPRTADYVHGRFG
jgi:phosphate transport system ATP-binding protein